MATARGAYVYQTDTFAFHLSAGGLWVVCGGDNKSEEQECKELHAQRFIPLYDKNPRKFRNFTFKVGFHSLFLSRDQLFDRLKDVSMGIGFQ